MPKRGSQYVTDDFVVDSDDGDAPSSKKSKNAAGTGTATKSSKDTRAAAAAAGGGEARQDTQTDDNGDVFWELKPGGTRRVGLSEFKGATMVNVREYYEKDGKMLPGKKGISLPLDQFARLVQVLPQLEGELRARGLEVPRPVYGEVRETEVEMGRDEEEEDGDGDGDAGRRKNHEATSDEDEG